MVKTSITGALFALDIDRSGVEPIHVQIVKGLHEAIGAGRLPAGLKLPSTRVLAGELGVSRNTVLQAFEALTQEGLLVGKVGAGTFVAGLAPEAAPISPAPTGNGADRQGGSYPFRSLSRQGRSLLASATGEILERPIPFMPDLPDLREFPIRTWLRLLHETSGRLTGEILADTSNAGYEPLRRAIAQHLNASRKMVCDFRQVVVTTGSQQSLDLVCRLLLDPGDPVWLEEPGYIGAHAVMAAHGASIHPVLVDAEGMRVADAVARHPVPRLVYTSPSRQYPLGATLSMARRSDLLDVAHRSGSWIVEDDYDHEFRYAGAAPPSIFGLDTQARTFYIGTFSKVLLPSFRLGYVVVPHDFADAFAKARAVIDRHASLIEQMVLSEFMLRGLLASHIRRMRGLYRTRQQQLVAGLKALYGEDIVIGATDTGMHVILPLQEGSDDAGIARALAKAGIVTRPLSLYYAGRQPSQGLLFGFAAFSQEEIGEGIGRLARQGSALGTKIKRAVPASSPP